MSFDNSKRLNKIIILNTCSASGITNISKGIVLILATLATHSLLLKLFSATSECSVSLNTLPTIIKFIRNKLFLETGNRSLFGVGSFVMSYLRGSDFLWCRVTRGSRIGQKSVMSFMDGPSLVFNLLALTLSPSK